MSAVDQTITLPAITPATPLVLCNAGFLNTLFPQAMHCPALPGVA